MANFNPNEHLTKLKNKDYLEVKWRLVWLRDACPSAQITTTLVHLDMDKGVAVFKASVDDGNNGIGEGHGSESVKDFGDYIEKAETKAIGRALAALGYGTQFAPEIEEGTRIVDSPVSTAQAASTNAVPAERLTFRVVYDAGATKGLWKAANGFYAFASAELGANVNKDTVKNLAAPNLEKLMKAVQEEAPIAQAS